MDGLPVVCKQGVRGSSPLSSTRQNSSFVILSWGVRAITVPLAGRGQHACGPVVLLTLAVLGWLGGA